MKPNQDQIIEAAKALRESEAGSAAIAHVHALLRGPLLDDQNQQHVLRILVGAWSGWYGSALDATMPPLTREQLYEQKAWQSYFEKQKRGGRSKTN